MMNREERTIVALTGCSHAFSHGCMLIFPAVLLLLQKEYSLGYLQLGVIGNIMNFTYGLGALPGGMIYNYFGPKKLYLLCLLGSAMALILVGISSSLILLTAGLALLGALGSIYHPLANSLITSKVREYGRALGIHGATGNIGLAITPFVAGLIASYHGWREAYLLFALPGIALSIWALFVDMPLAERTKPTDRSTLPEETFLRNLRKYFTPPLTCLYVINILNVFCYFGTITFLPIYMAKRTSFHFFSLDSVALAGMLSAIVLFMGVFGQFGGGLLSQRKNLERNFFFVAVIGFPFLLVMSFATDFLFLVLALTYFFFNFFIQPMNNTLIAQHATVGMRGTAFGIYFSIAFGVGSLASSFSGYIAQNFGLQWVFMGLSASGMLMAFFAFLLLKMKRRAKELSSK